MMPDGLGGLPAEFDAADRTVAALSGPFWQEALARLLGFTGLSLAPPHLRWRPRSMSVTRPLRDAAAAERAQLEAEDRAAEEAELAEAAEQWRVQMDRTNRQIAYGKRQLAQIKRWEKAKEREAAEIRKRLATWREGQAAR